MTHMDELQTELENTGARAAQVTRECEQFSNDIGNSLARYIDALGDLKEMFRTLARQVEALRGGTTPGSAPPENNTTPGAAPLENSATTVMDIEDLKNEVTRLIEQVDRLN